MISLFVIMALATCAPRTLAQHVIGICHNDKPHHFKAADQLICLTPRGISLAKQQGWTDDRLILLPHYHDCRYDSLPVSKADASLRVSAAGRLRRKISGCLFNSRTCQAQRPDIGFTLVGMAPRAPRLKIWPHKSPMNFTGWIDMDALDQSLI